MRTSLGELLSYGTEGIEEYANLNPGEKLKKLIERINDFKAGYGIQALVWLQIENSNLDVADLKQFCFYMRHGHYLVVEAAKKKLILQLQKLPVEELDSFSLVLLAEQIPGEIDKYLQKLLEKSYTSHCGNYWYTYTATGIALKYGKKELALLLAKRYVELRTKGFSDCYSSILNIVKDELGLATDIFRSKGEEKLYNFSKEVKKIVEEKLYDYIQK